MLEMECILGDRDRGERVEGRGIGKGIGNGSCGGWGKELWGTMGE